MTLNSAIKEFILSLPKDFKKKTIKSYEERLEYLDSFLKTSNYDGSTANLNQRLVTEFNEFISNSPTLGQNSRYVIAMAAQKFLRFLFNNHHVMIDFSAHIHLPKWRRFKKKTWTEKEASKLTKKLPNSSPIELRNKAITTLHVFHGLKSSMLSELNCIDVIIEHQLIRHIEKKRFLSLHPTCIEALNNYLKDRSKLHPSTEALFVVKTGNRRMTRQSISKLLKEKIND